jgi:hypothetical protein
MNDRVPELDDLAVRQADVLELDACIGREVRGRPGVDERREPGHMVGLHVRLEDRGDRRPHAFGRLEIGVDELDVRIDNR